MIHYHCADIWPAEKLLLLAGRNLLVSHAYPARAQIAHQIAQSVLLDNGAFSAWRSGRAVDWAGYYAWADEFLDTPTTWAIIPDVIGGGEAEQDRLVEEWPHGDRGAPVWHLDESLARLDRLADRFQRLCFGSAGLDYATIGTDHWRRRMDEAFNLLAARPGRLPWVHGLRMQGVGPLYPFGSVDSADIARNNNRPQNGIRKMADRWDAQQPRPGGWVILPEQSCMAV